MLERIAEGRTDLVVDYVGQEIRRMRKRAMGAPCCNGAPIMATFQPLDFC